MHFCLSAPPTHQHHHHHLNPLPFSPLRPPSPHVMKQSLWLFYRTEVFKKLQECITLHNEQMLWQQAHTLCIKNYFNFDCRRWFIETSVACNSNGFRMCFCCVISIINNMEAAHYMCLVFIKMRGFGAAADKIRLAELWSHGGFIWNLNRCERKIRIKTPPNDLLLVVGGLISDKEEA